MSIVTTKGMSRIESHAYRIQLGYTFYYGKNFSTVYINPAKLLNSPANYSGGFRSAFLRPLGRFVYPRLPISTDSTAYKRRQSPIAPPACIAAPDGSTRSPDTEKSGKRNLGGVWILKFVAASPGNGPHRIADANSWLSYTCGTAQHSHDTFSR